MRRACFGGSQYGAIHRLAVTRPARGDASRDSNAAGSEVRSAAARHQSASLDKSGLGRRPSLKPPSRATRRRPRERTRATGRLLEHPAEFAHRLHPIRSIEPEPVEDRSRVVRDCPALVLTDLPAGPVVAHYGIIANLNAEKPRKLAKPVENPSLPVAIIPPRVRVGAAKGRSSNAASDAVVNANTVFIDDERWVSAFPLPIGERDVTIACESDIVLEVGLPCSASAGRFRWKAPDTPRAKDRTNMSDRPSENLGGLEIDLARRIDDVCRRFERDARDGRHPRVEDYLGDVSAEGRAALRAELEALERELRQSDDQVAPPEASPPTAPVPQAPPHPSTIAEAPTMAPRPPPTSPMPNAAPSSVHEEVTVPPSHQPRSPHDEPTAAVIRQDSAATTGASEPTHIRYFGDYEILREIARGGMGVVFRARQVSLNRTVALKMILAGQLADDTDVKRFHTEAEAAANLDHPGIVPIYEVGQHEGQHYFSMGFVEGQSLSQRLADGPLPSREAAELIRRVSEAIEYAHQHGVIHRDLKPANILLDKNGNPRVTDFGLAKKVQGDSGLTGSGQIMGTPSYMPPEQAGGPRGEVGLAADIYSLGATLYALITGRPPFQAATAMDTVIQVIGAEPVPPRQLNASISRDLETICLKCLEKEPGKRYLSAAALGNDLRRFLNGEPILARPVGPAERSWRWCRRNLAVASLAGGVVLALTAGTVVATFFAVRADREAQRAREEKRLSERRLYVSQMNLARQAWQEGSMDKLQERLAAYEQQQSGDPDPRGFEWYYLKSLAELDLRTLEHRSSDVYAKAVGAQSVAFGPDGRTLAGGLGDGMAKLWDPATGSELFALRGHVGLRGQYLPVMDVAFSPDGRTLASASKDFTLKLWNVASGRELRTLAGHTQDVNAVKFSPDGRTLASASSDKSVKLWDLGSSQDVRTLGGHSNVVTDVAFSPDGRTLASASRDKTVKLWNVSSGQEVRILRAHSKPVSALAYSPDGRTLASAGADETIQLWDAATGQVTGFLHGHRGEVMHLAFSPDGNQLASAGDDQTVRVWRAATSEAILTLRGHQKRVCSVAYSPDGRTLASASWDSSVKLWDSNMSQDILILRGHSASADGVAFSPDGRTLASASSDKTVKLWDIATGQVLRTLVGHTKYVNAVAFSPDGRKLASGGGDRTVKLWDATTGQDARTLVGHEQFVTCLAFSLDGETVASASADSSVRLWNVGTGKGAGTFRGHTNPIGFGVAPVWCVAFSPDGRRLASSSYDVKIWDRVTRKTIHTLKAQRGEVRAVAYSPDGRTLASVASDGTARLWNTETGTEIETPRAHSGSLRSVAFSPDGQNFASGARRESSFGTVVLGSSSLPLPAPPAGSRAWRSAWTAAKSPERAGTAACSSGTRRP